MGGGRGAEQPAQDNLSHQDYFMILKISNFYDWKKIKSRTNLNVPVFVSFFSNQSNKNISVLNIKFNLFLQTQLRICCSYIKLPQTFILLKSKVIKKKKVPIHLLFFKWFL